MGEFWLECLSRLADQAPPRENAPDLRRTVEELRSIRDDRTLGDRCLGALLDFADREGRRLVLIVENLNMMFADMADSGAGWRLRKILQTEPRMLVLASATSRFDEIDNPDRALYDLFRTVLLRPLDTGECAVLWKRVSGHSRAPGTIEAMRILTGGSPRLLAILARFGAGLSFRELMAELLDLVDDHTEYFKSHLEALPAQERRVYLALADLWKPAMAREVADRARLDTSKCSAHLTRLIDRGVVEVAGGGARRKQYYLTERLYNIYYLMRRSRGPEPLIQALVRFMEAYYSADELKDFGVRLAWQNDADEEAFRRPALLHLIKSPLLVEHRDELMANIPGNLAKELAGNLALSNTVAIQAVHEKDHADESAETLEGLEAARALFEEAVALDSENRSDETLAKYDDVIWLTEESDTPVILELIANTLFHKGGLLEKSDRQGEALAVYSEVVDRFKANATAGVPELVAKSLIQTADILERQSRQEEALAALDEVMCRFAECDAPTLLSAAATALFKKGEVLRKLNRLEELLAANDEVVRRFGEHDAPAVRSMVEAAHVGTGIALCEASRPAEALDAFDTVVRKAGGTADVSGMFILARIGQGLSLHDLNRPVEALTAFEAAVALLDESECPSLRKMTGSVLLDQAALELKCERYAAAIATAGRALDGEPAPTAENRIRGHLIRIEVTLAGGDPSACREDIETILEILPELGALPSDVLGRLMVMSVELGPKDMHALIQASPSVRLLLPLATALEREMGLEPRVAREVEEVAQDIRERLAAMRESRCDGISQRNGQRCRAGREGTLTSVSSLPSGC